MAAVRGRSEPSQRSGSNPFFFSFTQGTARPQPKISVNYTRLRAFSESPVPRRAIDYIKNQISALDWDVVRKDGKIPNRTDRKKIEAVRNILEAPNSHESWRTFIEMIVEDLLVIGHASVEKRLWSTNPNKPMVLYPFDAASLQIYADWNGEASKPRFAQVDKYGRKVDFRDDQLMFIRYNPRTSSPWGLSPIEVAAQTIDYLLQTQAYAGRAASNATARKLIDFGADIDQQQLEELRTYWKSEVEGKGHQPIIGSGSAKTLELGATNDENLFLKWQGFLINQIANAFGLDAQKFSTVLATKSNGDVMDDASDEGAVRPLAASIAAAINREIIQALGYTDLEFRFRWTSNLKDRRSLAAIHQIYATQDVMTIDEIRKEIGLEPLPDGKGQYTLAEYRGIYGSMNTFSGVPGGEFEDMKKQGIDPSQGDANMQKVKMTMDQNQQNQYATPALKDPQNQNAVKDKFKIG